MLYNIYMKKQYCPKALDYHGYGIVNEENKTYFIKDLLIDEVGEIQIIKESDNLVFARTNKLIKRSPNRTDYPYNEIEDLIILNPKMQLKFQEDITSNTFNKFKLNYELSPIINNDEIYYYRNKGSFIYDKNSNQIGNYIENTHKFYIPNNHLLKEEIINFQTNFNNFLKSLNIKFNNLDKLVVHVNEKSELMVSFILFKGTVLPKELLNFDYKACLVINLVAMDKKNTKVYFGKDYLKFIINNKVFLTNARSFLQVNTSMIKLIYDEIKNNIEPSDIVLDAFAGSATIAQYIADKVSEIHAIEIARESKRLFELSIKENKINNIKYICGDYFKMYNNLSSKINTIIIDPPRKGLSKELTNSFINNDNITKLIYLSCNLKTLARDLSNLEDYFEITKVIPIKNFYNTTENETLVILKRLQNVII